MYFLVFVEISFFILWYVCISINEAKRKPKKANQRESSTHIFLSSFSNRNSEVRNKKKKKKNEKKKRIQRDLYNVMRINNSYFFNTIVTARKILNFFSPPRCPSLCPFILFSCILFFNDGSQWFQFNRNRFNTMYL